MVTKMSSKQILYKVVGGGGRDGEVVYIRCFVRAVFSVRHGGEHRTFVVDEFIPNGGSVISTQ